MQPMRAARPEPATPVLGLFEAHLTVTDLERSIEFYRDVVGLDLAYADASGHSAFFWIGSVGHSMLGLWAAGSSPERMTHRVAFRTTLAGVMDAPRLLRNAGVAPLDLQGRPTEQPVVLAWMPAAVVCFRDPDGHELQYMTVIEDRPRPEFGVIPWRMWELARDPAAVVEFSRTLR